MAATASRSSSLPCVCPGGSSAARWRRCPPGSAPARGGGRVGNAALPFLAAGGGEGRARALELYRALPRPAAYGPVRHLDEALGGAVRGGARRQPGMLVLPR